MSAGEERDAQLSDVRQYFAYLDPDREVWPASRTVKLQFDDDGNVTSYSTLADLGPAVSGSEARRAAFHRAVYHLTAWENAELARMRRGARISRSLSRYVSRSSVSALPRVDPPALALRVFAAGDADHYAREWHAHLWELVVAGKHRTARWHRRGLALAAPLLALQIRLRALLRQRRRSWR